MKTVIAYTFRNRTGAWSIRLQNGRWQAMFEDEGLGSYHTPEAAHDDLIIGATFWPSSGDDPSECGLPEELAEWKRVVHD